MSIDMMVIVLACLAALLTTGYSRKVPVTRYACGSKFELDKGDEVEFTYYGSDLQMSTCKLEMKRDSFGHEVCARIVMSDALCSGMKVEYHKAIYSSYYADEEITCGSPNKNEEFCASSTLVIALKRTSDSFDTGAHLQIKTYLKEDEFFSSNVPQLVKTTSYIVIGVVVGCIVLMIVIVVVIIICCCRRRSAASGTVYRTPQMAAVTTTTHASYPAQQQPYQPHAGYQPPPQTGYQPGAYPPPAGYPSAQQTTGYPPAPQQAVYSPAPQQAGYPPAPQQAAYPPAPQQGYTGYQASSAPGSQEPAPTSEKPPIASAPPMSEVYPLQQMAPPPYPGN